MSKQVVEFEIEVPEGMEFVGMDIDGTELTPRFKKYCKQGEELNGLFCGFSDDSFEDAEKEAEEIGNVSICIRFENKNWDSYLSGFGDKFRFACPVSKEKLIELTNKLGE